MFCFPLLNRRTAALLRIVPFLLLACPLPARADSALMTLTSDSLRIASPPATTSIRLQVQNAQGETIFDSGEVADPAYAWDFLDTQGKRVPVGVYVVNLSVRHADGTLATTADSIELKAASDSDESMTTRGIVPRAGTVTGSGTIGYITKWVGANQIANSVIFESSSGNIGIGTTSPTSKLTVAGTLTATGTQGPIINGVNNGGKTGLAGVGVFGSANGGSIGVYGRNLGTGYGMSGNSTQGTGISGTSSTGTGIVAVHSGLSGTNPGLLAQTNSRVANASAIVGQVSASPADATSAGVRGINTAGAGVSGQSTTGNGVQGQSDSATASGVYGINNSLGDGVGVYGEAPGFDSRGVFGSGDTGVYGKGNIGVYGDSTAAGGGSGVYGTSYAGGGSGVYGTSYAGGGTGVLGESSDGNGVQGISSSASASGVYGANDSSGGFGVAGRANGSGTAVFGENTNASGYAGSFVGNVHINGTLSKTAGSFKIDDPLDPANKYLSHSFIESPDMMNIYNGNTTTDAHGFATVTLPAYFSALNRDFRYQLTPIGQFLQAIVQDKIHDNRFRIRTDKPNIEVSWQVTGVRHETYAQAHRIPVETAKVGSERGKYLFPAGFGQPASKQIGSEMKLAKK